MLRSFEMAARSVTNSQMRTGIERFSLLFCIFGTPVVLIGAVNSDGTPHLVPLSSVFWLGWRGLLVGRLIPNCPKPHLTG